MCLGATLSFLAQVLGVRCRVEVLVERRLVSAGLSAV